MYCSPRGELICPIIVQICPLDTRATEISTDDVPTGGYNPFLREPIALKDCTTTRKEGECYRLPAQVIRQRNRYGFLQAQAGGFQNETIVHLGFHLEDLEKAGLVDDKGVPLLKIGDRLDSYYHKFTKKLIRCFQDDQKMFCIEVHDRGIGFDGNRNLIRATFSTRDLSTVSAVR